MTESDSPPPAEPAAPKFSRAVRWGHLLLCGLGGFVQCLGFAGFSLWPFALVSFLPMMWVLDRELPEASTKRVLALGLFHGAVGYAGGYYWLYTFLETFSGYSGAPSLAFASIFWTYQGGQQMLIYWLYSRARRRGYPVTLSAVPALLTLELLYPVLFPAFLASGFHEVPLFLQIADLGGPMLLSAVAMAFNAALYEGVRAAVRKEPLPKKTLGAVLAAVLFTLGYGAYRISEVDGRVAEAETINVGMVQVNMGIFAKREEPFEGHRRHLMQSRRLEAREELDLLVWPESAFTFFLPEGSTNLRQRVLPGIQSPVVFGGLARREVDGERRHYNTAYLADGTGEIVATYDKTYLLAFGEYLPLGETFPILYEWSPNSGHFTPGDHVRPLVLEREEGEPIRISTLICYEDVLPGFTRKAVREGDPNLLVNITNDAWFGDTHEPWIHLALAKFRAVEHHRALVRSTNSGVTAFVDPVGRTIDTIGVNERDEIAAELPLLDSPTLYQWVGDWPGWVGLGGIVFMAFIGRRKRDDEDPSDESDADDEVSDS
ncbi:MAG: apolipoprotein N-acyltransferase [Deltaproteobacteria bacterium]|nr:apolipoprotein N-acyltransferase [Deltaproteobacteria bacterium]